MTIRSLGVFCGSSSRVDEAYRDAAARLGAAIAEQGVTLVYGGGNIGLMGILADAALGAGGRVIGVIPRFLRDLENRANPIGRIIAVRGQAVNFHQVKMREAIDVTPGDKFLQFTQVLIEGL